jgi:hypothetical protein
MSGYGYGISVSGSRTPVVASITPAPATLPLSTATLTINGITPYLRQNNANWLANYGAIDGYYYWLTFGYGLTTPNAWEVWIDDGNGGQTLQSTNLASSSAIPLTGWSPSITITTP